MNFANTKFRKLLPAATFAMVAEFAMELSNMVICGHMLGVDALSSINLIHPVFNIVSFVSLMVGTGASVLFSTEIGAFRERRAHEYFTQGLLSAISFGALLFVLLLFGADTFVDLFHASEAVSGFARTYLHWYLPCTILSPVAVFLANMCYSDGDSKTCFQSYLVQLASNFACAIVLANYFGIAGCAIGTLIGNLAAIVMLSRHFVRQGNNLKFVAHCSLRDAFRICWCAIGDASLRLCYAALFFLLNLYVISHFGSERLPVLSVVIAVLGLAEAFDGVATAVQPLVSVYIGERNDVRIGSVMNRAVCLALAESAAVAVLLLVAPSLALRLVGVDDPELIAPAQTAVRLVAPGLVAISTMMLFNSYYMFIGRESLAAFITIGTMFVSPCVFFPAMGALWGEKGLWSALAVAPIVAVSISLIFVYFKFGREKFPFFLDPARKRHIKVFDLELEPSSICGTSAAVGEHLRKSGIEHLRASKASLLVEEALMVVLERNSGKRVLAEVTVDLNDGLHLVLRDDGVIFDITDADAEISSLRVYLVSNLMEAIPSRRNLTTTGFNRNVFKL